VLGLDEFRAAVDGAGEVSQGGPADDDRYLTMGALKYVVSNLNNRGPLTALYLSRGQMPMPAPHPHAKRRAVSKLASEDKMFKDYVNARKRRDHGEGGRSPKVREVLHQGEEDL
jgi:hypothetical protein